MASGVGRRAQLLLRPEQLLVGTTPLGGLYAPVSEADADATVARCLERGLTNFDTAPLYGLGAAETRLGRAVARHGFADTARVWTKVGRLVVDRKSPGSHLKEEKEEEEDVTADADGVKIYADAPQTKQCELDYSAPGVRRSFDDSRRRLGGVPVFGARVHDPEVKSGRFAQLALKEALPAVCEMRAAGLVKEVSVGTNCPATAMLFVSEKGVDSLMLAGCWNLLDQSGFDVLRAARDRTLPVHLAGIYASGYLAGGEHYKYAAPDTNVADRARRWAALAKRNGASLQAVALAFASFAPSADRLAVGLRSPREVDETLEFFEEARRLLESGRDKPIWLDARREGLLSESLFSSGNVDFFDDGSSDRSDDRVS